MSDLRLQHANPSIVLVGSFNPAIFQPQWFAQHQILPEETTRSANIELINNTVCIFEVGWLRFEVLPDRFVAQARALPTPNLLRDVVVGTFSILSHTPIHRFGINSSVHIVLDDESRWHKLGHTLAPVDGLWGEVMEKPGLVGLTMRGERPDRDLGHFQVTVGPSAEVELGVHVQTNDEFRFTLGETVLDASWAVETLNRDWDASLERSSKVHAAVLREWSGAET